MERIFPAATPQRMDLGGDGGPSISIIIPCYEQSDKLWRTTWSIHQTCDLPYELIVAEGKQCVARNRNVGLARAGQRLIVMMDDDVILPPFWASTFAWILQNHPDVGVISPRMTGMEGRAQNDLYDVAHGELRACRPPGTCFMYDRGKLAGCMFDEGYLASQWEDTDFMMQVQAKGLKTCAVGSVWILHDNQWTGATPKNWAENRARFEEKWAKVSA